MSHLYHETPNEESKCAQCAKEHDMDELRDKLAALEAVNADLGDELDKESERLVEVELERDEARAAQQVEYASAVRALALMVQAVKDLDAENGDRNLFVSAGCLTCTEGITPYNRDTGPCAFHRSTAVLTTPAARAVLEQEGK